jgi:hypothetical protein
MIFNGWDRYLQDLRANQSSPQTPQPTRIVTRDASLEAIACRPTTNDKAPPNGSSIAFLAEFRDRSILFGADAFPTVLYPALLRLARDRSGFSDDVAEDDVPPLHVDVFKLPHHGSRANIAADLFDVIRADHYVISTSGKRFDHPDEEAMARVILYGRPSHGGQHTLWFNYASETTMRWMDPTLMRTYGYATAGAKPDGPVGAILKI